MSDIAVATEAKRDYPYFTEEHEMIRQTVKRFCREEIAPHAEQWDHDGIFPRELFKKAANLGLFGIRIDPEWGGLGLGPMAIRPRRAIPRSWSSATIPAGRSCATSTPWPATAITARCGWSTAW